MEVQREPQKTKELLHSIVQKQLMNNPVHHKIVTDGLLQHYITVGEGPVMRCMHGWPQNHREFLPVMEGLSDRYRFMAPDLRGFADSGKPDIRFSLRFQ